MLHPSLIQRHNLMLSELHEDLRALRGHAELEDLLEGVVDCLMRLVPSPGDSAIDIGAGYGRYTWPLAHAVGAAGRVYAFEPIAPVAASLEAAAARAGLGGVIQVRVAMPAAEARTMPFPAACRLDRRDACDAVFRLPAAGAGAAASQPATVRTVALDRELPELQKLSLVRCAAGGGELAALRGAAGLLAAHRPLVVFEEVYEDARPQEHDRDELFGFFDALSYELRDAFGCRYLRHDWWRHGPWLLVAAPAEHRGAVADLLPLCVARSACPTMGGGGRVRRASDAMSGDR